MSNLYTEEILKLLIKNNAEPNSDGLFIFTVWNDWTVVLDRDGKAQAFKEETGLVPLESLEPDDQHYIFSWIQDNQYALRDLMREKLTDLQINPFDESGFIGEPQTIFAESEGGEEIMLGKLGLVHDVTPEGDFRRIIFVSPDGSWTTLTGWYKGDETGKGLAMSDLSDISHHIKEFIRKVGDD